MADQPDLAPRMAHPIEAYVACRAMGYRVPPKERKYLRHGGLINKAGTLTDKGERLLKRLKYLRKFKRVEEKVEMSQTPPELHPAAVDAASRAQSEAAA